MEWSRGTTIESFRDPDVEVGEENTRLSHCHEFVVGYDREPNEPMRRMGEEASEIVKAPATVRR
jgi:hypothetical protein